jgi:hypothetical protein
VPIATCPAPKYDDFARRGGRFGAHNLHDNGPLPAVWQSEGVILGTFFNGGLRAYDISNQYEPKEVAAFVQPAPEGAPQGTIQLNDVFVDERLSSTPSVKPHVRRAATRREHVRATRVQRRLLKMNW